MLVTHNNGQSWTILNNPNRIFGTAFMDSVSGIGYKTEGPPSYYSSVHTTNNGGITWDSVPAQFENITGLTFVKDDNPAKNFYLLTNIYGAYYSQDSGKTWTLFDNISHEKLSFYNSQSGLSYSSLGGMNRYVGPITSIKEATRIHTLVQAFPNPTGNVVSFTGLMPDAEYTLFIHDVQGRELIRTPITNISETNISTLHSGLYLFKITEKNKTYSIGKLMIN